MLPILPKHTHVSVTFLYPLKPLYRLIYAKCYQYYLIFKVFVNLIYFSLVDFFRSTNIV